MIADDCNDCNSTKSNSQDESGVMEAEEQHIQDQAETAEIHDAVDTAEPIQTEVCQSVLDEPAMDEYEIKPSEEKVVPKEESTMVTEEPTPVQNAPNSLPEEVASVNDRLTAYKSRVSTVEQSSDKEQTKVNSIDSFKKNYLKKAEPPTNASLSPSS